jgi:hypothetical protein
LAKRRASSTLQSTHPIIRPCAKNQASLALLLTKQHEREAMETLIGRLHHDSAFDPQAFIRSQPACDPIANPITSRQKY